MTNEQWRDVGERVAWTFAQGAAGSAVVLTQVDSWSGLTQALGIMGVAGGAAVLALLKGMVKARRASA